MEEDGEAIAWNGEGGITYRPNNASHISLLGPLPLFTISGIFWAFCGEVSVL